MNRSATYLCTLLAIVLCPPVTAASGNAVIVEGVVPDDATRTDLLARLHAVYGDTPVMDRLEVAPVTTPANWSRYVGQAITADLKKISAGSLVVDGNAVRMRGKVADTDTRDALKTRIQSAFNATYDVQSDLAVEDTGNRQQVLDATLGHRTVQFESGSAVLTPQGRVVLDDMGAAITRVGVTQLDIVGHTDSVGDRQANILLSMARADAVKAYLAERGIARNRMIVSGHGPDIPVADNETTTGRAKNRRIEFVIRRDS